MDGPQKLVDHFNANGYHPRSNAHSNVFCLAILEDIIESCPPIKRRAELGELVGKLNISQTVGHDDWNIDLAVGPPAGNPTPPDPEDHIKFERPALIHLAIEAKGVMTEHGKARRNRLRDLQAFHGHAHRYSSKTIAVGIVVINASPVFWSPTRSPNDVTHHRNIERLLSETIDIYRNLPLRGTLGDGEGLEAACVVVVRHDNLNQNPNLPGDAPRPSLAEIVDSSPAPTTGDPLNYATMIRRVCEFYQERFAV